MAAHKDGGRRATENGSVSSAPLWARAGWAEVEDFGGSPKGRQRKLTLPGGGELDLDVKAGQGFLEAGTAVFFHPQHDLGAAERAVVLALELHLGRVDEALDGADASADGRAQPGSPAAATGGAPGGAGGAGATCGRRPVTRS
jgi:hypothetical protein